MAGPVTTVAQAPMNARDTGPVSARAAPPAPKMLGDLGSVVPGRFDSRAEGVTRRIAEPSADATDRYSPVGVPAPGSTPAAPSRAEMPRTIPAPDLEPPSEPEIPGADALRRLIAGVVPPSSLAPSAPAPAPAPNADDVQTEVVLPMQARAPEAVTAPNVLPRPAAPAAKHAEPVPTAKQAEAAPAAKPAAPVPAAQDKEPAPAAKLPEATPAKSPTLAAEPKAVPVQPAPAARSAAPTPTPTISPSAGALPTVRTMDETVVELLRPLLRDWLDTNMPRLIEPALKAELEALRGAMSKDKKD
jgi:cell pole-organizing protein PopZ